MTAVKNITGQKLLVQIGDGGGSETFAPDCMINASRGAKFSSDVTSYTVPDCDDPDAPAWKTAIVDGLQVVITGAGKVHTTSVETFWDWFSSGEAKNIRFKVDATGANGGGYWAGAFVLTEFDLTGEPKNSAEFTCSMMSSGAVTWTDNS